MQICFRGRLVLVCAICCLALASPLSAETADIRLPAPVESLKRLEQAVAGGTVAEAERIGTPLIKEAPLAVAKDAARILIALGRGENQWTLVYTAAAAMLSRSAGSSRREWLCWQARALEETDRTAALELYREILRSTGRDEFLFRALERLTGDGDLDINPDDRLLIAERAMSIGRGKLALSLLSAGGEPPADKAGFELWVKACLRTRRSPRQVLQIIQQMREQDENMIGFGVALGEAMLFRRLGHHAEARKLYEKLITKHDSIWKKQEVYWPLLSLVKQLTGLASYLESIAAYLEQGLSTSFKERLLWRMYDHLQRLGNAEQCLKVLFMLVDQHTDSFQLSRATFLLGRTLLASDDDEQKKKGVGLLTGVTRLNPHSLYGVFAGRLLVSRKLAPEDFGLRPLLQPDSGMLHATGREFPISDSRIRLSLTELVGLLPGDTYREVRRLYRLGRVKDAYLTYCCLLTEQRRPAAEALLAAAANDQDRAAALWAGGIGNEDISDRLLSRFAYPVAWWDNVVAEAGKHGIDPFLVLAVIKAESGFRPHLVSSACAIGLMQIIPSTGGYIAGKLKDTAFSTMELFDPAVNIKMGAWYLGFLLKTFKGDLLQALAGYNGGPTNARRWLSAAASSDPADFLESVTYDETRSYVRKVIDNYLQYHHLYGEKE